MARPTGSAKWRSSAARPARNRRFSCCNPWHADPTLTGMEINGRRSFLKQAATLAGAFSCNNLFQQAHAAEFATAGARIADLSPDVAAQDEDYWSVIQRAYSVNPNLI